MKNKRTIIPALLILMITSVGAVFQVDDSTSFINENYLGGETIKGKLNATFSNQENLNFSSDFEGGISLLDLLNLSGHVKNVDFSCMPSSCKDSYEAGSGAQTKTALVGQTKSFFGFKIISEEVKAIRELKFTINSNAAESCSNQISIDFLDDGKKDFFNKNYIPETCGEKNYGCFFGNDIAPEEAIIEGDAYCEKMNLSSAPAYTIGAVISVLESGGTLQFSLHKGTGELLDFVNIINPPSGEIKTIVEYPSPENFTALVCLSKISSEGDYRIKSKPAGNYSCGGRVNSNANDILILGADYEIFAQPMKYGLPDTLTFDSEFYQETTGANLNDKTENYLEELFDSKCPAPLGCTIPFSVWGVPQDININSASIEYDTGTSIKEETKIFDLTKSKAELSSDKYLILDVEDMMFKAPNINGDNVLKIYLGGAKVFESDINVEVGFDFDIGPRFAFIGRPTTFTALGSRNITSSIWEFGENTINSENNKATYTFNEKGEFTLKVNALSGNESSVKTFKVVVGEPKLSANLTLSDYENRIKNIETKTAAFPQWIKEELEKEISLGAKKAELMGLRTQFNSVQEPNDDNYIEIINFLLEMNLPKSIELTETGTLPIEVSLTSLDPSHIEELSGRNATGSDEVASGIISWMQDNYEADIKFETISATYDFSTQTILKTYKIILRQKNTNSDLSYLIIGHPKNSIKFKSYYEERTVSQSDNSAYIIIDESGEPGTIEFLITGNAPPVDELGLYISPTLDKLGSSGKPLDRNLTDDEGNFLWGRFIIGMAILIVLILAIYLLLQSWYKRYYEKHLFKNPDDLYNLINFIYNSRKSGVSEKQITAKLSEKKWKNEQIVYAFKKIDGERTGMWEIPLFKFMENKKVKKEIERKQGAPIDARFIKRPFF
ncbi:PKD domain-containing protein [Candidatus Pacearchaeota archaeon]|nr:PKD domain-containing protein [Candidatus Pacearchaeota archaeon]